MARTVSNFSDLIQRVTASCFLHPLADIAGRNRSEEAYDSDELEEEEETESEEAQGERNGGGSGAWEGREKQVGMEKVMEMQTLMSQVFDAVSAMKRAYVTLQETHSPWDPAKMRVADVAMVAELRRLGVLRERFRQNSISTNDYGGGRKTRGKVVEVGTVREVVAPYEAVVEELKSAMKAREVEIANLKEKLKVVASDCGNGKKGRSRSKHKGSFTLAQVSPVSPAPELFEATMAQVREATKSFTSHILSLMRSARLDISALVRSIEAASSHYNTTTTTTSINSIHHAKYAMESYLCTKIFQGFDHETFYMDGSLSSLLNPDQFRRDCFNQFRDMKAMEPTELLGILPTCHFGKFCSNKYLAIVHPKMEESLIRDLDHRRQVLAGTHPRSEFYCRFLGLAKAIWLLHLLAFSLDPTPSLFEASRGAEFHSQYMESVVKFSGGGIPAGQVVGFPVCLGFKLGNGSVIKARVFLVSRS